MYYILSGASIPRSLNAFLITILAESTRINRTLLNETDSAFITASFE